MVEDGVHQVRLFRAPIWCPSGGGGTREAGDTVAESLLMVGRSSKQKRTATRSIGRVSIRSDEGGGQLNRRQARVVLNTSARESNAQTGRFLREKLISAHGLFSSYKGQKEAANGQDSWGGFHGCTGLWMAGC